MRRLGQGAKSVDQFLKQQTHENLDPPKWTPAFAGVTIFEMNQTFSRHACEGRHPCGLAECMGSGRYGKALPHGSFNNDEQM